MLLLDFPDDVLSIVLSDLTPQDYLRFCRVSKQVYLKYRQDPAYWRHETAFTFRLPISPLLAADGPRWYWLYKRLKTQTRLYTWGQGVKGNLGAGRARSVPRRGPVAGPVPSRQIPLIPHRPQPARLPARPTAPRIGHPHQVFQRTSSSWPTEVHIEDEVGVIADLQCGGWSTTILSSSGRLYTTGTIDSRDGRSIGESTDHFRQLEYLTQSNSAVRQFSSGRSHILALTDDGQIISWDRINTNGLTIFSREGIPFEHKPTRVAAGWAESSAYIPELGIIYWTPLRNDQTDQMLDGMPVKEKVVPGTAHRVTDGLHFEVIKHIVLEDYIVYITSESKVYACSVRTADQDQSEPSQHPFEIPGFTAPGRELKDIQGQFRKFGVFTAQGEVLSGDADYIRRCGDAIANDPEILSSSDWSTLTTLLGSRPPEIPALQHTGVIALAFGDYHHHALHSNGDITSYGTDSQSCGSLGLSGPQNGGRFRGLRRDQGGHRPDSKLLPIANVRGRRIWFEPEKKDWLQWMEDELDKPHLKQDGVPARQIWDEDVSKQSAFSEWVEQEGKHWEEGPSDVASTATPSGSGTQTQAHAEDYAHLGSYFPIAIAAAGWHSGALVLVDEEKAHEVRDKWVSRREEHAEEDKTRSMPGAFEHLDLDEVYVWKKAGFPKVRLPTGYEMPGEGEPRTWRDGLPSMHDLKLE
jgi:SCF-associated factor 1